MHTLLATTHKYVLAGALLFALVASPAYANFDMNDDDSSSSNKSSGILQPPRNVDDGMHGANMAAGPSDSFGNFGPSSGTVVGNRALELRDEVLRLRASVNMNETEFNTQRSGGTAGSVQYHSTVAAITARLQNGTTKGNPILLRQWDEANNALNEVGSSMSHLNSLQTAVEADASLADYLLGSIQAAFDLSGAVDEDHDQLKILRDEVSRLVVRLNYMRGQISNDLQRQTSYMTTERSNLQTLAFAIMRGELVPSNTPSVPSMNRAIQPASMNSSMQMSAAPMSAPMAAPVPPVQPGVAGPEPMSPTDYMRETQDAAPSADAGGLPANIGHLLVLIRYNQPTVDYQAQLSQAIGAALERRPNAHFSVVAVSPSSGDPSEIAKDQQAAANDAEDVKRSLMQLGLASSRISMANTQTQSAGVPEVHVYIR